MRKLYNEMAFEYVDCDEKKKIVEPTVENRRSKCTYRETLYTKEL